MRKSYLLFPAIAFFVISCNNPASTKYPGVHVPAGAGIHPDTLDIIYDGPKGLRLEYFPREAIQSARVSECEILQSDDNNERIAKKARFDKTGNLIEDENNYFSDWDAGTARGHYKYLYNNAHNITKATGVGEEKSKDSSSAITTYTDNGLIAVREFYTFSRKLKAGADAHLPAPDDFVKKPSWGKDKTSTFLHKGDTIFIDMVDYNNNHRLEKYILQFDSLKRTSVVTTYYDSVLIRTTKYSYARNSVIENSELILSAGHKTYYHARVLLNDQNRQIENTTFNDNGEESSKKTVTYNKDGTINSIRYGSSLQVFKYKYY